MSQDITCSDHFCGAGGATIGMKAAGVVVTDAANHWPVACEVYGSNNPDTRVHCADMNLLNPRRFPRTDLAWFSPECKTFSMAAGNDRLPSLFDESPDSFVERSRVSMHDVIRFTAHHRYDVVMVENVIEVSRKYPIDWWYGEMCKLGYDFKVLSINSMVCWPTPQSRDRWYACFWKIGNKAPDFEIRPKSWCPECESDVEAYQWFKREPKGDPRAQCGKYRQQYLYKCPRCHEPALPYVWPALAALDLSIPCPRIGDREKPLAEATLRRIDVGLERYGPGAIVQGAGNCFERPGYYRTWPLWRPLNALTSTNQYGVALDPSMMVPLAHGETGPAATLSDWPAGTQTGRNETGLVVVPMRTHNSPRSPGEPLAPFTTAHGGGHGLVDYLVDGGKGTHPAQPAAHPGPAVTGWGSHFIVALRNHGEARPVAEPVGTFSAEGNHHGLMVRMNGNVDDAPSMATPWDGPAGTITGAANQAVVPFLTQYNRTGQSHPTSEPVRTLTGTDRYGLVEPTTVERDDCGFRMLEPAEAGLGMGFPGSYRVNGSKRTQVRLYGQAVTPPVSAEISGRAIASLT